MVLLPLLLGNEQHTDSPTTRIARTVAITVDDLPYAAGDPDRTYSTADADEALRVNRQLVAGLRKAKAVTGFVNGKRAEELGDAGVQILKLWQDAGALLGNHTYSHADANTLSIAQEEEEIRRGEALLPVTTNKFLRFPYNHTGDTKEKHDAIAQFLKARGYAVAACTIDTSDYVFNHAYVEMLKAHDAKSARKLMQAYLDYTSAEIDYYAAFNAKVLGHEPPEVMLLHDDRLNADAINEVLQLFRKKGYRFVSLQDAQKDPAYHGPETFVTKFGPMWGYRWAAERKVKYDGRLEPEVPQWVEQYGKAKEPVTPSPRH